MARIMNVFYGANGLPYQDKERQVHYPILGGNTFNGSSLVDTIHFYVKELGGVNDITWVANVKRADGKIGYKVLTPTYDSESEEYYVSLSLSQWFTAKQGDIFISLNGYQGGLTLVYDSESQVYTTISGTPIVQATGCVKLNINYAVQMNNDYGELPTISVQEALALVSSKLDKNSKGYIHIADTLPSGDDLDNIEDGTLYLVDRTLYKYNSSSSTFSIFYQLNAITITGTSGSLLDYANIITSNSNVILARYVQGSSQSNPSRYEFYTLKGHNTVTGDRTFERLELTQGTNDFTITKQVITVTLGFAWYLTTTTNTTLNESYVNAQLGLKADKSYVDTELDLKADKSYVDTNFGHSLALNIDSSTYVLTINLVDKENNVLSSQNIDLPLESIVTDVGYYATYEYQGTTYEKVIVIELATTSEPTIVPVGDLVSGLVSQTNSPNQVYATNSSGNQITLTYGQLGNNTIVQRDSNGFIKQFNAPINDDDIPNKQYVDAVGTILNNAKVDKTTTIAGIDLFDDITANELKTALNIDNLSNELKYLCELKWNDGQALIRNNTTTPIAGFSTSDYIPIMEGIVVTGSNLYTETGTFISMAFVDANYNLLAISNSAIATAPANAAYVRFGKLKATTNASISYSDYLSKKIIAKFATFNTKRDMQHAFGEEVSWESGKYLDVNGVERNIGTCSISQFLSCVPREVFTATGMLFADAFSAIAFYDKGKSFIGNVQIASDDNSYTVPDGAYYLRFCKLASSAFSFYSNYSLIKFLMSNAIGSSAVNSRDVVKANDMTSDLVITTPTIKWGFEVDFHARVTTMGQLVIGKSIREYGSAYVRVTDTTLYICMYANNQEYVLNGNGNGDAHGLTFDKEITVILNYTPSSLQVILKGVGSASFTSSAYVQGNGFADTVKAKAENSGVYSNCELSYYCRDIENKLWVCADSYASYWAKKAYDLGYEKALINALPGQNSVGALTQLNRALAKGTPKVLFWALGMNDGDSGAVNTNWKNTLDEVISICNARGIELVLSTIPNVPNIDNSYKNAYIKASGYRYADVCECVGADLSSSWYSGLLGTDNVHPSDDGAKVIANYICSQLPEMR